MVHASVQINLPDQDFKPFNPKTILNPLIERILVSDLKSIKDIARWAIEEIILTPSDIFMTRHTLESIYRIAHFMPSRVEMASRKGLASPAPLILSLMEGHVRALKGTHRIDLLAGPIQQRGIPIECNELPDLIHDILPKN